MTMVGKYSLLTDFHTAGGGQCRWAFAARDGKEYFIKEFLRPTYPMPGGPGSEQTKAAKRRQCEAFEARHRQMMRELKKLSVDGGNLIVAKDFFRDGAKFYKVTDKVDVSSVDVDQVHQLSLDNQLVLATAVAHSLQVLHRLHLVHGDLKPPNVLLKETARGFQTAKLIDFDDSFKAGAPPPSADLVGDIVYYSPETHRYVQEDRGPEHLIEAADIFALGVLFTEYFVGERPRVIGADGSEYATTALGVLSGGRVVTGLVEKRPGLDQLIRDMLLLAPERRPTVSEVVNRLKSIRRLDAESAPSGPDGVSGRLKGSLLGRSKPEPALPESTADRLRGSLARDRRAGGG